MYYQENYISSESNHRLPKNIHIFQNDPLMQMLLAKLGHADTYQPKLNRYFQYAYEYLLNKSLNLMVDVQEKSSETRMKQDHDQGVVRYKSLDPKSEFSVLDLARAGTWPSHICFDYLNHHFSHQNIRQDHIYINRKVDEAGKVIGVNFTGSKIGGDFNNKYIVIPDPMGATGSTISHVVNMIRESKDNYKKILVLHLIMTPEYVKRMRKDFPEVEVFCLRYDRGLSPDAILSTPYGEKLDEERGLSDIDYILPGAGGIGEVLNNSYV